MMPKYRSHKEVRALQIDHIEEGNIWNPWVIHFVDKGITPKNVDAKMFVHYFPHRGDYLVIDDVGYESISPQAVFESGYTRI